MSPVNQTDSSFVFQPHPPPIPDQGTFPGGSGPPGPPPPRPGAGGPPPATPLPPPLDALVGTWSGTGFNTIWRPHFPATHDRFLELNVTDETLVFRPINGPIPNRGLLQADINMFGVTYMQQISDASDHAGLHIEPGIWAVVPQTSDPLLPPTVVRMASIPHGTTILAQGTVTTAAGPPKIDDNDIIPFGLDGKPPVKSTFAIAEQIFTELNLTVPTEFRQTSDAITEAMVENPNSVLQSALQGKNVTSTTTLSIASNDSPVPGGGTSNTAFLQGGASNAQQSNAVTSLVTATFWIETIAGEGGHERRQLQYSQTVMLDFNNLRWPHVTVATLTRQPETGPHQA